MSKIEAERYDLAARGSSTPARRSPAAMRLAARPGRRGRSVQSARRPAARAGRGRRRPPGPEADRAEPGLQRAEVHPARRPVTVTADGHGGELETGGRRHRRGHRPEDLERLGRPYEQAGDAGAARRRAPGLGLSLVQAFAKLHGGEMSIESRLGEGACGELCGLPVAGADRRAGDARHAALDRGRFEPDLIRTRTVPAAFFRRPAAGRGCDPLSDVVSPSCRLSR